MPLSSITDHRGKPVVLYGLMSDRPRELDDGAVPLEVQEAIDREVRSPDAEHRHTPADGARFEAPKIVGILVTLAFGGVFWGIHAHTGLVITKASALFIGVLVFAIGAMATLPFRRRFYSLQRGASIIAAFIARRRCPACGYDLAGAVVGEDGCTVCSECGAAWRLP